MAAAEEIRLNIQTPETILLYRANNLRNTAITNITAAEFYGIEYNKYFALTADDTRPYQKREGHQKYVYTWVSTQPLRLVNMFDLETRNRFHAEAYNIVKNAYDTAFPVREGKVFRYSDEDTVHLDNICLADICSKGYDGYIISEQRGFHPEVGICRGSLHKLRLHVAPVKGTEKPKEKPESRKQSRLNSTNRNKTGNKVSISRTLFSGGRKFRKSRKNLRK